MWWRWDLFVHWLLYGKYLKKKKKHKMFNCNFQSSSSSSSSSLSSMSSWEACCSSKDSLSASSSSSDGSRASVISGPLGYSFCGSGGAEGLYPFPAYFRPHPMYMFSNLLNWQTAHGYVGTFPHHANSKNRNPEDLLTYFPQAYVCAPGQRLERNTATACWEVRVEDIFKLHGGVLNISDRHKYEVIFSSTRKIFHKVSCVLITPCFLFHNKKQLL